MLISPTEFDEFFTHAQFWIDSRKDKEHPLNYPTLEEGRVIFTDREPNEWHYTDYTYIEPTIHGEFQIVQTDTLAPNSAHDTTLQQRGLIFSHFSWAAQYMLSLIVSYSFEYDVSRSLFQELDNQPLKDGFGKEELSSIPPQYSFKSGPLARRYLLDQPHYYYVGSIYHADYHSQYVNEDYDYFHRYLEGKI